MSPSGPAPEELEAFADELVAESRATQAEREEGEPHYDDLDEEAQAARWRRLIAERIRRLDLAVEFEAEGRPYATLDGDGNVVVRGGAA